MCFFVKTLFVHKTDVLNMIFDLYDELKKYNGIENEMFETLKKECFKQDTTSNNYTYHTYNDINIFAHDLEELFDNICDKHIPNTFILNNQNVRQEFRKSNIKKIFDAVFIELIDKYNNLPKEYEKDYTITTTILTYKLRQNFIPSLNIDNDIIKNNPINLLSKLNNINSYQYNILGNVNGIDINNYFSLKSKPAIDIYVDSYNLVDYINQYNNNHEKNMISLSDGSIIRKTAYIKIIDRTHLIEYCKKLKNDIYNINVKISNKNLLDKIFVKKRYWYIMDKKMYPIDRYITLYDAIYNELIKIDMPEKDNKMYEVYRKKLIYFTYLHTADTNEVINFLLECLSTERNSKTNNFIFNFGINPNTNENIELNLDICISKNLIKLNNSLKEILKDNSYLYLYINDKCANENIVSWDIVSDKDIDNTYRNINEYYVSLFNNVYYNNNDNDVIQKMLAGGKINSNNQYLVSYDKYFKEIDPDTIMTSIIESYDEFLNHGTLLNDNMILNIYGISDNNLINAWEEYRIENEIYIEDLYEQTIGISAYERYITELFEFIKRYNKDIYYSILEYKGIILYSIKESINIQCDNVKLTKDITYDKNSKMYVYKSQEGINYGFYWISLSIDNTNNSFNIKNDYNYNIVFNKIDDISLDENNEKSKYYFHDHFYLIEPFLKINIFNEFSKIINNIIYPYETEIIIDYISSILNDDNEKTKYNILKDNSQDTLYDNIIKLKKSRKIKLLRYFNYITPHIKKKTIIEDCFALKFIDKNNIYKNVKKYNIFAKDNINIYKYNGIKLYDGVYSNLYNSFINDDLIDVPQIIQQYEYKHFNDNLIYNLPTEIIIKESRKYTYDDINNLESNSIKDKKIKMLSLYFNKKGLDYNNIILFLFNKYDSNIIIEPIKLHTSKYDNLYKITYKFNLI